MPIRYHVVKERTETGCLDTKYYNKKKRSTTGTKNGWLNEKNRNIQDRNIEIWNENESKTIDNSIKRNIEIKKFDKITYIDQ